MWLRETDQALVYNVPRVAGQQSKDSMGIIARLYGQGFMMAGLDLNAKSVGTDLIIGVNGFRYGMLALKHGPALFPMVMGLFEISEV